MVEDVALFVMADCRYRSESALRKPNLHGKWAGLGEITMPDYRRNFVPGGTYFFTVALLERKRDLLVTEIAALRQAVRRVKGLYPFDIVAWVVLPDHLHSTAWMQEVGQRREQLPSIWTLPDGDSDYPTRWRLIKLLFAKGLPKVERLSAVRKRRNERGIWHRRYWEHTIRDERDLNNHIDYVHWNPVKHGLVSAVKDWPYSTFHRYVHAGILPSNWMAANIELDVVVGEVE